MKKIDLGRTIGILANLGVIAGIIFLGVELRQNNELMEAEARRARFEQAFPKKYSAVLVSRPLWSRLRVRMS